MEISAKVVMELRAKTGVSMMACKKALEEAQGDMDAAVDILRKSGEAKAMKKADRETKEGIVDTRISSDGKKGFLVQVLCETDFVARNADFVALVDDILNKAASEGAEAAQAYGATKVQDAVVTMGENIQLGTVQEVIADRVSSYTHSNKKVACLVAFTGGVSDELGRDVAMQVVASSPDAVSADQIDAAVVEKEAEIYSEQLKNEGKPAEMIEKILAGKVTKFKEERSLLTQDFVKDPSKKIKDILPEGAHIVSFVRVAV